MNDWWALPMLITGGLFAGGVVTIAWERIPAWRTADPADFRLAFAHTLRRVDRLQPALLTISLASTAGFALTASGFARTSAALAGGGLLVILVGSAAWLIPIQRRLVAAQMDQPEVDMLRSQWLRGHLIRTAVALVALILAIVATLA
jgi:Anthrone oxygenase